SNLGVIWTRNDFGVTREDRDKTAGFAVDGGGLFYAPRYEDKSGAALPYTSGVYAFDADAGTPRWTKASTPQSNVSAGDGLVYLLEGASPGTALVARRQSDGSVAWSTAISSPGC